jgi:hypothetical protein
VAIHKVLQFGPEYSDMAHKAPHWIKFSSIGEKDIGYISVVENATLPFKIERVYWTYYTPNDVERGNHAHKQLEQILVAVSGTIDIETEDLEGTQLKFTLNTPSEGLYIPPLHWRKIRFSHNAVLLCMVSWKFTQADYIRDYIEFKSIGKSR